jgi:methionine-rich copper-binding protein CopC
VKATAARRRSLAPALATLGLTLALWPAVAGAHAVLVKSSPARRAALAQSPARVELWFSERLEPAYSSASVWSASGQRVDRGDAAPDSNDPKVLGVGLPSLPPGQYTVRFRVLSVDGHVVESSFPFTIKPPR